MYNREMMLLKLKKAQWEKEQKIKGIRVSKPHENKEKEASILEGYAPKQIELLNALRKKDIKKIKEWCNHYDAWSTLMTFKSMGLIKYKGNIYSNDMFLNIINNEGIRLYKSQYK